MSSRGEADMEAALQRAASEERPFKVFISLRFGEALEQSQLLKEVLEQQHSVDVFLCDVEPGGEMAKRIIKALAGCDLAIIMGTKTYGKETASPFSTYQELRYITAEKKPFFFIKMCERFEEDETRFHLPDTYSYFPWMTDGVPSEQVTLPSDLVAKLMEKLRSLSVREESPQLQARRHPRRKPRLSKPLCTWLEWYGLLYTVGFALEKLGIADFQALEAATETFRSTKARVKAKQRAMGRSRKHKKQSKGSRREKQGNRQGGLWPPHEQSLLLEGTLRRHKIRAAEIGRFARASKLATWRHRLAEDDGSEEGSDLTLENGERKQADTGCERRSDMDEGGGSAGKVKQRDTESHSSASAPATSLPPRRGGLADEERFLENLKQVKDKRQKARILAIWNNTCGAEVSLRRIELRANGVRAIAEALKATTTLKELQLHFNNIGAEGARVIGQALKGNCMLTWLSLNGNNIGDEGARWVCECLKANTTLTSLNLGYNKIGNEGARFIAKSLHLASGLLSLNLDRNEIGPDGASSIGEMLKANSTLTTLYLDFNSINDIGGRRLLDGLASNTKLTTLTVHNNPMSDRMGSQINDAVERNQRRQEELLALVQFGSVPLSTAKVFVCGDYGIGKTTLIRTLRSAHSRVGAALRGFRGHRDDPGKASERTPGIQVHRVQVRRSSSSSFSRSCSRSSFMTAAESSLKTTTAALCDLRVYDFAGQLEYHVVHELLLADHNAVFVICVDLTKDLGMVQDRLTHWLSFIKTRLQQAPVRSNDPPQVIVVGTKADKPHREHLFATDSEGMTAVVRGDEVVQSDELKTLFGDSVCIHPHLIPLNCHDARGANMQRLRDLLHGAWTAVVQREVQVPRLVEQIADGLDVCRQEHNGPWPLSRLVWRLRTAVPDLKFLEYVDDNTIARALKYLHVRGDILWFSSIPSLSDHVFVSPSWLLSNVVGPALAPDHFVITRLKPRDGEVSLQEIERVFGQLMDANVVVDVLCSMLLCFPLPPGCSKDELSDATPRYLLPSRLDAKPDHMWRRSQSAECFGGRRFVVSRESGMVFPPGLFPRLQSRLAVLLGEDTSMWRTGFLGLYGPVECFGRIEGNHSIDLWVRGLEPHKEHVWLALCMMLLELEDEAERIEYEHHVLSHTHLSSYRRRPAGYPIEDVEKAVEDNDITLQRVVKIEGEDGALTRETVTDTLDTLLREDLFLLPLKRQGGATSDETVA